MEDPETLTTFAKFPSVFAHVAWCSILVFFPFEEHSCNPLVPSFSPSRIGVLAPSSPTLFFIICYTLALQSKLFALIIVNWPHYYFAKSIWSSSTSWVVPSLYVGFTFIPIANSGRNG